jgi:hypothetical protein
MKKPKLKPKTVKRLRKIQQAIRREPRLFDMNGYIDTSSTVAPCGTAACIAGYACFHKLVAEKGPMSWKRAGVLIDDERHMTLGRAKLYLDLDAEQAQRLFFFTKHIDDNDPDHWPIPFEKAYILAEDDENWDMVAEISIARIEHFINTGGME